MVARLSSRARTDSFSHSVTSWPRSAATRAASRPAAPAPTTSTFFLVSAGTTAISRSRRNAGFTRQRRCGVSFMRSSSHVAQWLQRRMSSGAPSAILLGMSGSAHRARANIARSISPFSSAASAFSGVAKPTPNTGADTACLMAAAGGMERPSPSRRSRNCFMSSSGDGYIQ